jgi:heterodisulfide reductase subunit A
LLGKPVKVEADMVILETAMVPANGIEEVTTKLSIAKDSDGWITEAHPKLRPVKPRQMEFILQVLVRAERHS